MQANPITFPEVIVSLKMNIERMNVTIGYADVNPTTFDTLSVLNENVNANVAIAPHKAPIRA